MKMLLKSVFLLVILGVFCTSQPWYGYRYNMVRGPEVQNCNSTRNLEINPLSTCLIKEACYDHRRYYFEPHTKRSHDDAELMCKAIGMKLVSVESCEENAFIVEFIFEMKCNNEFFWTSGNLNNENEEKIWTWKSTGEPFNYTNWYTDEPNNAKMDEFCVHYTTNYPKWNDETCSEKFLFICESDIPC